MALIEQSVDSGVAVITLNRPEKRNAITPDAQQLFIDLLLETQADDDVTVVVITGAGNDFCVGGDFDVVEAMRSDAAFGDFLFNLHARNAEVLLAYAKPTIAAVNGPALGFGAELAAFCDMVVMSRNAYLCDPHVKYGVKPAPGAYLLWPQLTSRAIAAELMLTGRKVLPDEALRLGLVNRVVPEGQALPAALELARELCVLPREGVLMAKAALRRSYRDMLRAAAWDEAAMQDR